MNIKLENGFLVIQIPEAQARELSIFEIRDFFESKTTRKKPSEKAELYTPYKKPSETEVDFLTELPDRFTTAEAIEIGEGIGLCKRSVARFIRDNESFSKIRHGEYRKQKEAIRFVDFEYYQKIILDNFEIDKNGFVTTTEIFETLLDAEGGHLALSKIGQALAQMDVVRYSRRIKGNPLWGYALSQITR